MPPRATLEKLYDEHAQAVFAYALNLTRNEADAHDILQEVFLKLARQPETLAALREPRGYLLRLAHNQTMDLFRRQAVRQNRAEALSSEPETVFAPTADPDEATFRHSLAQALAELPPEQRAVVHLKLWEDMTFETIGAVLGISPNTAASRYRYGLDKLQARLRPLYEELRA
ncbi:MAG: sigma-70 family RNA polymerase sigma factor [Verrucomicrobiae bacterium]|nr:sigma-70 family RNA polymerase sigma factor [Verrucomicrobiae bacterium]